jgi:hypothetical protein
MKFIDFYSSIFKSPMFSLHDLKMANIKIYPLLITKWAKKGYIIKLRNGLYVFKERSGLSVLK